MQELGLLDLFPYLAMGLSGDKLDSVQHNPGEGVLAEQNQSSRQGTRDGRQDRVKGCYVQRNAGGVASAAIPEQLLFGRWVLDRGRKFRSGGFWGVGQQVWEGQGLEAEQGFMSFGASQWSWKSVCFAMPPSADVAAGVLPSVGRIGCAEGRGRGWAGRCIWPLGDARGDRKGVVVTLAADAPMRGGGPVGSWLGRGRWQRRRGTCRLGAWSGRVGGRRMAAANALIRGQRQQHCPQGDRRQWRKCRTGIGQRLGGACRVRRRGLRGCGQFFVGRGTGYGGERSSQVGEGLSGRAPRGTEPSPPGARWPPSIKAVVRRAPGGWGPALPWGLGVGGLACPRGLGAGAAHRMRRRDAGGAGAAG